jgi:hypothetical protein
MWPYCGHLKLQQSFIDQWDWPGLDLRYVGFMWPLFLIAQFYLSGNYQGLYLRMHTKIDMRLNEIGLYA